MGGGGRTPRKCGLRCKRKRPAELQPSQSCSVGCLHTTRLVGENGLAEKQEKKITDFKIFVPPPVSTYCFPLILTDSSSAQPALKSSLHFISILFPSSLAWNSISVNTKQSRCTEISNCSYCFFSFFTPLEEVTTILYLVIRRCINFDQNYL